MRGVTLGAEYKGW